MSVEAASGWRSFVPAPVRPYVETAPFASLFLGVSSGMPYAMIAATLTTRLAQDGITKSSITAFALAFLVYNLKFLWAWMIDGVYLPVIGRLGQRVSWLILTGALVVAAIFNLALVDPTANLGATAVAAVLVAVAGASFDIVIDAYRIELLEPRQLGVGSGMNQYGWRIGSAAAGAVALYLAVPLGWDGAYMVCALFALPAVLVGLVLGEPARHRVVFERRSLAATVEAIVGPFREFLQR
jgi:PAT family beta-lactamase induction signal transducer AmpG